MSESFLRILVGSAIYFALKGLKRLISLWKEQRQQPEAVKAELSETDNEMVDKSREVIQENFGDDMVETMKNASSLDRVKLIDKFANDLAEAYGLDITIDIIADNSLCGFYCDAEKRVTFNVHLLMVDSDHPHFATLVREAVCTIIHELRHAVQWQATRDASFWNVGDERANLWKENFNNYIDPQVDVRGYSKQPVEADAETFAAEVMREVE